MAEFVPTKPFLRGILLHYFHRKTTAAEAHRILVETYGDNALSEQTCRRWFQRFKGGDFDIEDEQHPGAEKKFEDTELEALLDEDPCQRQEELAETLGVDQSTVSRRLKQLGMIQKQGNWVPYELKPRDIERRFFTLRTAAQATKKKRFSASNCYW